MTPNSSWYQNHKLKIFVGASIVAGGAIVWVFKLYEYLDLVFQFLIRTGTLVDQNSKLVVAKPWFVILLILIVLVISGLVGLVWRMSRGETPIEPGELAERYSKLDGECRKARKLLGDMMKATALIRNQVYPIGTPMKSFDSVKVTYYIYNDLSARVVRAYGLRAVKEPLHFWATKNSASPAADPAQYFEDIAFEVTDENDDPRPYLPIRNDEKTKEILIYFLPRIEPGESSARQVRITLKWPKYLKQMEKDGFENFTYTFESISPIQTVEFSYFLQPGTGKKLMLERMIPRLNGDQLLPESVKYEGEIWTGFSYKVTNGPAGTFAYQLRAKLENA